MKFAEIEELAKLKRKEHRMRIDKIKDTARQLNRDRHDIRMHNAPVERVFYDEYYLGR